MSSIEFFGNENEYGRKGATVKDNPSSFFLQETFKSSVSSHLNDNIR